MEDKFFLEIPEESIKDIESLEANKRYQRGMNRIFREHVGIKKIPYPEADNIFERSRSWLIVKFHLKPFKSKSRY